MIVLLLHLHRKYAEIMEEAGCLEDFEKLMDALENLHEGYDFVDRIMKVLEAYTVLEDTCRRARKYIPPTILNNLRADITDIIEATPLTP